MRIVAGHRRRIVRRSQYPEFGAQSFTYASVENTIDRQSPENFFRLSIIIQDWRRIQWNRFLEPVPGCISRTGTDIRTYKFSYFVEHEPELPYTM